MNELTERERELLALIRAEPQLALQLYEIVVKYKRKEKIANNESKVITE